MLGSAAFRFVLVKLSKRPELGRLRSPLPLRVGLWAEVVDDSDEVEPYSVVSAERHNDKVDDERNVRNLSDVHVYRSCR